MGIIYNMCSGLALVSGHAEDRGRRSDRRVKAAEKWPGLETEHGGRGSCLGVLGSVSTV